MVGGILHWGRETNCDPTKVVYCGSFVNVPTAAGGKKSGWVGAARGAQKIFAAGHAGG